MKPIKYPTPGYNIFSIEDYSYPLRATTGLDDFFKEEGYLSVDAGELLYIPTATYTMETGGELDDYIAAFEQYRNEGDPFYGKFNSIEELFAYNKENQE
ncbi:MAG: hypothetical protein IJB51_05660, partial [Clostridia bacterium]|nr:hypothetical protein [Clostridia bacterium]